MFSCVLYLCGFKSRTDAFSAVILSDCGRGILFSPDLLITILFGHP
jgi:hypothetical protein